MITLFAITQKGGKTYCAPSWVQIGMLLQKFHDVKIKRRWIFQCLKDIHEYGLITRLERKAPQVNGEFNQKPGLISFTIKGMKYLHRKRVGGALGVLKKMMQWLKKKDRRWPKKEEIMPECTPAQVKKNLERLRAIFDAL
jgi:hypothetical protein